MFHERIDDFVRETGREPPHVEHLSREDCERLRECVASTLGLPSSVGGASLVKILREKQRPTGMLITDVNFSLTRAFEDLNLRPKLSLYRNWAQFNLIDRFKSRFICRHIQDLLYPGGDDIDLFDESFSWVVSVDYECRVQSFVVRDSKGSSS